MRRLVEGASFFHLRAILRRRLFAKLGYRYYSARCARAIYKKRRGIFFVTHRVGLYPRMNE